MDRKKVIIASIAVVAVIIIELVLYAQWSQPLRKPLVQQVVTQSKQPLSQGSLTIRTQNGSTTFKVGDEVVVVVSGTSAGKPVAGYDLVMRYDPTVLSYKSAETKRTEFQIFKRNDVFDPLLHLTGVKGIAATAPAVLADTPLTEIHFTAQTPGKVSLSFELVKNPSTLVVDDSSAENILRSTNTVQVIITK